MKNVAQKQENEQWIKAGTRLRNLRIDRGFPSIDALIDGTENKKTGKHIDGIADLFPDSKTNRVTITNYELGKKPISYKYACILGKVLRCSPDYLLLKRDTVSDFYEAAMLAWKENESISRLHHWFFDFLSMNDINLEKVPQEFTPGEFRDVHPDAYTLSYNGRDIEISYRDMVKLEHAVFKYASMRLMEVFEQEEE